MKVEQVVEHGGVGYTLEERPVVGPSPTLNSRPGCEKRQKEKWRKTTTNTQIYTWRPDGLLTQTIDTAGATDYIYNNMNFLETDEAGTPRRYYLRGPGGLIAHIDTADGIRYYHTDEQGSTLALSDENGAVVAQYAYGSYGEQWGQHGETTAYTWLGSHGVYHDGREHYHMKARYYHAGQKRFISRGIEKGQTRRVVKAKGS